MKTAVITGGSGGIGKIIAKALHGGGFEIILIARNEENLNNAVQKIGPNTKIFSCDITEYERVVEVFDKIENVDVLVNCAGILGPTKPLVDSEIRNMRRVLDVNLFGTVNCCKAAISKLENSERGKIINISGGGAAYARPLHAAYATSKAAVVRFTEELAHELKNVDVNVIAPGAHETKLWEEETVDKAPAQWANPEDVSKLILYLSSEKSNGITGKFIHIKDNYTDFTPEISESDMYSLRRLDELLLEKLEK
jgi:3-oxoacyl-[acyl-carrier protein] reductase